jgi:hypothetical protein
MSEDLLKSLLPALDIAAFERREDGSFTSLAPPPAWFGRLVADPAFPFLGHILEEANVFWRSGGPGLREWGPVAEVDASGAEFHYKVAAVVTADARFLVFRLDQATEQIRRVMQTIRSRQLEAEQSGPESAAGQTARLTARHAAHALDEVLERFRKGGGDVAELSATSEALLQAVRALDEPTRLRQ